MVIYLQKRDMLPRKDDLRVRAVEIILIKNTKLRDLLWFSILHMEQLLSSKNNKYKYLHSIYRYILYRV